MKLVWTREEEFTWAYFRPAGVIDISSGAKADGSLLYWAHDNYNSGPSAMRTPTKFPINESRFTNLKLPCDRDRIARWPRLQTTLPASRTWTNWRMR